jgi:hypothetical protein
MRHNILRMLSCLAVTFVARAGHCAFTPAETIAAVQTLLERLATSKWPDVNAASLNSAAIVLGPNFNIFATSQGAIVPVVPAFVDFSRALISVRLMPKRKSVTPAARAASAIRILICTGTTAVHGSVLCRIGCEYKTAF